MTREVWDEIMALTLSIKTEWGGYLKATEDKYGDWSIAYVGTYICTESEKLTDTMAKILIYLYGNKLIKM